MTADASAAPIRDEGAARRRHRFAGRMPAIAWVLTVLCIKFVAPPAWAKPLVGVAVGLIVFRLVRLLRRERPRSAHAAVRHLCGAAILLTVTMPSHWRSWLIDSGWYVLPVGVLVLHLALGSVRGVEHARAAPADFRRRLAAFLACLLPSRLADFAATDVNLLSYVVPWLRRRDAPPGHLAFDYHRQIRPLLLVFIMLAAVEAAAGHLMLIHARPAIRWTAFAVSDVGLLYFVALAASLGKLPLLVGRDHVLVRAGIFIELDIPIDVISSVGGASTTDRPVRGGSFNTALMSPPTVHIEFSREIVVHLPFKGARQVRRAGVRPDDPAAFIRAVEGALAGHVQQSVVTPCMRGRSSEASLEMPPRREDLRFATPST